MYQVPIIKREEAIGIIVWSRINTRFGYGASFQCQRSVGINNTGYGATTRINCHASQKATNAKAQG